MYTELKCYHSRCFFRPGEAGFCKLIINYTSIPWGGGGGYSLIKALLVFAAPPGRVFAPFWSGNGYCIHFAHFALESGMVFVGTKECMNVFTVSISNK